MSTGDVAQARRLPPEIARLIRFCEVGAANTVITLGVFAGLLHVGAPAWAASALAFAAGALNGYYWNARWTFADRRPGGRPSTVWARYLTVQGFGALASAAGVSLANGPAGLTHLDAELVIIPVVTALTFALMRGFVFPRSLVVGEPAPS